MRCVVVIAQYMTAPTAIEMVLKTIPVKPMAPTSRSSVPSPTARNGRQVPYPDK